MRVLVTGASGQVGKALQASLKGWEIEAADRRSLDLARPELLPGRLDELGPALIINAAAYTAVDRAEEDRDGAFLINATAPGVLADWAGARQIPLIHFSTDYVFDGQGDRRWKEEDRTRPLSVYGESKLAGEQAVLGAEGDALVIRTSWVYAARGNNFLRTIARLSRHREQLKVVADQVGAPTSAALIGEGVATMLAGGLDAFRGRATECKGIINLTATGETSWYGFARAIIDGLRARNVDLKLERLVPIASREYPTAANRPLNSRLDLTRLQNVFGITPVHWLNALEQELDGLAAELAQ